MKVNDAELLVRDNGGAGMPVLLIHGGWAKDFLLPVAEELIATGKFRVISYDRRGYGRKKYTPVDMKGHAEDAAAILQQLNVKKAHVFGHSYGGSIALELARRHPEMVASLSLGEPDLPLHHLASAAEHEAGLQELAHCYNADTKKDVLAGACTWLHGEDFMNVLPPPMFELAADDMGIFVDSEYKAYKDWDLTQDHVKAFKMPIQVIFSEKAVKMSMETVDVLKQLQSRTALVKIPGATHFFPVTHPRVVAQAIASLATQAN
jgi:pimeloyl-ACP methyl ester carboxylesterase